MFSSKERRCAFLVFLLLVTVASADDVPFHRRIFDVLSSKCHDPVQLSVAILASRLCATVDSKCRLRAFVCYLPDHITLLESSRCLISCACVRNMSSQQRDPVC
jgi:hypothetical protein